MVETSSCCRRRRRAGTVEEAASVGEGNRRSSCAIATCSVQLRYLGGAAGSLLLRRCRSSPHGFPLPRHHRFRRRRRRGALPRLRRGSFPLPQRPTRARSGSWSPPSLRSNPYNGGLRRRFAWEHGHRAVDERRDGSIVTAPLEGVFCKKTLHVDGNRRGVVLALSL